MNLAKLLQRIGFALFLVSFLTGGFWIYRFTSRPFSTPAIAAGAPSSPSQETPTNIPVQLAAFEISFPQEGVTRSSMLHTELQDTSSFQIREYEVQPGDSAWSIAQKYDLKPESILWGNEGLSASAASLKVGAVLKILPVDGVLHTVKDSDTIERLVALHGSTVEEIIAYPGNDFNLFPPYKLEPGSQVIIPNGTNPIVWEAPGPVVLPGSGRKSPGYYSGSLVYIGSGYFTWPTAPPYYLTSGYWPGHSGIDIDTYSRQPIFAADSGTVIFSGWDTTGFGNLVIVDHGNGYWTYYGHNTANLVSAGQGVLQGQQIAESGTTGNSTGDHLDFRIRVDGGGFVNPINFLP